MASATMDHMISLIVFIAAILIFIGLFSQPIQTAIVYESHRALSTKTSDLLDTILLNPGIPANWGQSDCNVSDINGFGLQDPEFTQYQLSPFSLMRLSSTGNLVEYDKTSPSIYYNNASLGFGASLLTPNAQALNYSASLALLGINNTYGFQLTLTPDITVSITETHASSPLNLSISATGTGFPFANAPINYCLIQVTLPQTDAEYPSYTIQNGAVTTDQQGIADNVTFPSVTDSNQVYAFIAYTHLDGIVGVGYHTRDSSTDQYVVPIVQDMASQEVALAHNYDLNNSNPAQYSLKYNATFVISTEDYTLSELSLGSPSSQGIVTSGVGNPYPSIPLPTCTTGILIVTYQQEGSTQGGVVMMPWGISSLAFPVTFGGNPHGQVWVATDIRQVTIGGIAYQAKLALWNQGVQVIG
jgi:hypothetical protein